jgi:uncharacterized protein (DUF924 family)
MIMVDDGRPVRSGDRSEEVLEFWFGAADSPHAGSFREIWFERDAGFDAEIRRRFLNDVEAAAAGDLDGWRDAARSCLALILLLDQFPRNLFRGDPRAWATDPMAKATADHVLAQSYDQCLPATMRSFVYMPLMHSEDLADQRRSVALFEQLGHATSLLAARRHLYIIDRFGRFPHRNGILGRETTSEEAAFLQEPDSSF